MDEELLRIIDLFDNDEVTTADKIDRPQKALEREMYDDFMKRNKLAGGGMLVQPSADGSRPGYAGDKSLKPGQKKYASIGDTPGIFKVSSRNSDQIKFAIAYTDNEGNYKTFRSPGGFKKYYSS